MDGTLRKTRLSVAVAIALASRTAGAVDFVVNSTDDAIVNDGLITLREAVLASSENTTINDDLPAGDPTGDTIGFNPAVFTGSESIVLSDALGPLRIRDDLVINGFSAPNVTINGNGGNGILEVTTAEPVEISGLDLINGNSTGDGGALNLLTGCNVTLNGLYLLGNKATRGGGIFSGCSTLTITNSTITGNSASLNGGGLHTSSATISISNSTISNNTAGQEGGGLWNSAAGSVSLTNSYIHSNLALIANASNDAQGGGGIFNNGGTISIQNTDIHSNEVINNAGGVDDGGGGIFNDGRNQAGARIELLVGTIIYNNTVAGGLLNGGGILNIGSAAGNGPEVSATTGVHVLSNTAARAGGGIESNNGVLTLTGVQISGNSVGVNGGGLHVSSADIVAITESTISGNTAGQEGGGLWNSAIGNMTVSGSTVTANVALIGNADSDAQGGGGIFNNGGTVSIHNSSITKNEVEGASSGGDDGGGGIFNDGRNTHTALLQLTGATSVSDNKLLNTGLNGGGIVNLGMVGTPGATLNVSGGVSITGNAATRVGGGISSANGDLTVTGAEISGNSVGINGGGIHVNGPDITNITASTISNNTAGQEGGGLWNSATGIMEIVGSTISGNTALISNANNNAQGGGGVFNNGGTVSIHNSSITLNQVSGNLGGEDDGGGGVFNDGQFSLSARMVLSGSTTLADNTVVGSNLNGGGGFNHGFFGLLGANLILAEGVRVTGNTAPRAGGGIASLNGAVNITGAEISGNSAGISGGGADSTKSTLSISNSTISGNTASSGGGVSVPDSGFLEISFATVADNTAYTLGGGFSIGGETGMINGSLIAINQAPIGPDVSGMLESVTYSLLSNTSGVSISTGANNLLDVDPEINDLADNGGPSMTHALLPNSPAINNGGPDCMRFDQRGFTRPDELCDIGAFEFGAFLFLHFIHGFETLIKN